MRQNREKEQKAEFIDSMLTGVNQIPVEDIVGSVVTLYRRGRYLMGLCPFHPDHNLGSFIVTPDKNLWRCFAEGIGGNGVRFEMEYYKLSYLEAAFKLAREYQIITEEEYNRYSGKRWDNTMVQRIREKIEEPKQEEGKKASQEVIAAVYSAIPEVCRLSDVHKRHLLHERMLKEENLKDYFTFPTRRMDLANKVFIRIGEKTARTKFGKRLDELNEKEREELLQKMERVQDELPYVPGFYQDRNRVDFASYKGIGILVRDDTGRPLGIQIRRDTVKNGEKRYVWFSSAFAQPQSGASSGSPGGFLKGNGKRELCITEGRFKAEQIASHGNDAIYLSGVSAWKSVLPMLSRVKGNRKSVFLMFDSDMLGNVAVHKQLSALRDELTKMGLGCYVILWSKKNGKGFDDLVANKGQRYASFLSHRTYASFETTYNEALCKVLKLYAVEDVRGIKPENADSFASDLQDVAEKEFKLKID